MEGTEYFEVELPLAVGNDLYEQGIATSPPRDSKAAGALAEIAMFAAAFASDTAVIVTLLQGPATVKAIAVSIASRRKSRAAPYWLRARGPGGQAHIELNESIDAAVLEGLLRAIWQIAPEPEPTEDTKSLSE